MEQKIKYQYTYFIYPYVVKEQKYDKYMLKLLKNKNCHLQLLEKEKDWDIYQFFLPTLRENMFKSSFLFSQEKIKKFKKFDMDMQASLLASYPCVMFEYDIGKNAQGKTGEEDGIFFQLDKIQLICFRSGICFFLMKTNIEDSTRFNDVINFNYKFRDIKSEVNLKDYENIKIQTNTFQNMKTLSDMMREVIGNEEYSKSLDIDTNRFYTYAYTCLEQEYWNHEVPFESIEYDVYKYMNVLPARYQSDYNEKQMKLLSDGKYIKIGLTKLSCNLITSSINTANYTTLAHTYEHEYLYMYLLAIYKKIYLKKIEKEFGKHANKTSKKFVTFINQLWKHEITNDEMGSLLNDKIHKTLELDKQFLAVKNKYDLMCKELKIEKTYKMNGLLLILFIASITLNIINLMILLKK